MYIDFVSHWPILSTELSAGRMRSAAAAWPDWELWLLSQAISLCASVK